MAEIRAGEMDGWVSGFGWQAGSPGADEKMVVQADFRGPFQPGERGAVVGATWASFPPASGPYFGLLFVDSRPCFSYPKVLARCCACGPDSSRTGSRMAF